MEIRRFDDFEEAKNFAKSLGQQKITHNLKRNEFFWVVEYNNIENKYFSCEIESLKKIIEELNFEISRLNYQLKNDKNIYENQIQNLNENNRILLKNYEDELENEILKKTKEKKSEMDRKIREMDQKILESDQKISERNQKIFQYEQELRKIAESRRKLELIEKAYADHFGIAEVKIVKDKVSSNTRCTKCGGDGGINGGCRACDGRGWIDEVEISREVVEIQGRK